ncbi:MAG: serine acetyltransferase [Pseudomonadota bacterium]
MFLRLHRINHWLWSRKVPFVPWFIKVFFRIVFGVVLPPSVKVGRGVIISYQGLGTVIHKEAAIGDRAVISSCVTLGGRSGLKGAPVIEEGALIGSGAKVLGPVTVGKWASVGANAVVLSDVPAFAVVVGVPARVVKYNSLEDLPDYANF